MDFTLASLADGPRDSIAVQDANGQWTRGELRAAVASVASGLRSRGLGPTDRIAVRAVPTRATIAALLGARATGALVLPVDPRRTAMARSETGAAVLLTDATPEGPEALSIQRLLETASDHAPATPNARAWGFATSGSGGRPRTVVLSESSVRHVTEAVQRVVPYLAADRILCALPLHHTYGFSQLWLALHARATLLLPPTPLLPADLLAWCQSATVLPTLAPKMRSLLPLGARPLLRLVTLAGQATMPADRSAFAAGFPETAFVVYYGLTEASTRVLWLPPEEFLPRAGAAGRPIPGVTAQLEEGGEMIVEGPNVALDYLDDPEATAKRFREGRLHTGDRFERDGDAFRFVGRVDGTFKRFGEMVTPEVVEAALMSHDRVKECLVTAEAVGEDIEPVAWIVPTEPAPSAESLRAHVRKLVPTVMVPTRIRFVTELAKTAAGKIVRRAPA